MQFIYHLLLALPVFIFLQLMVYVIYLDRRSLANWLCAAYLFILLFSSAGEYYHLIYKDFYFVRIFNPISSCLWAVMPAVFFHFIMLLTEHHWAKKKWIIYLNYLAVVPPIFQPFFDNLQYFEINEAFWAWQFNSDQSRFLFWYTQIIPFIVLFEILYLLTTAQSVKTNYRVQKQVSLIRKAVYITIVIFLIPWHLTVIFKWKYYPVIENYGALILTGTIVYGMSRYRLQSLKTSKLISDMIEQFSGFTMVINPNGEILSANKQSSVYLGFDKLELEQKNIENIIEDAALFKSELVKVMLDPTYSPNLELKLKNKDNIALNIKTGINAIRNQFGEVLGYFLVFYGFSDEVKRYDKLQQAYELTNREKDVAMLLIKGLSNQAIADTLFVSLATVKTHSHNIYSKTNTKNKSELRNLVEAE
jgi:DNA-binding CsgD family transcriptional regulator